MRTINVDALIEKFEKDKFDRCRDDYQSGYNDGMLHAEVVADNFPTVDAVPVIRCGVCRRKRYCSFYRGDENDFCSWAEGKEE